MAPVIGFVQREDDRLVLNGERFRIVGANIYSFGFRSAEEQGRLLDLAESFGFNVLRIWAFHDQSETPQDGQVCFQYLKPGEALPEAREGPDGLGLLDNAVRLAAARGIRLILTLTNANPAYGGIPLYQRWLGLDRAAAFYREPRAREAFQEWIRIVTSRYVNEPAILAWEIANEPRCPGDASGTARITDWIGEMSRFIRAHAPLHLIAAGDEGWFDGLPDRRGWFYDGSLGVSFEDILAIPEIDFGTCHFYPDRWAAREDPVFLGEQWIIDHLGAGVRAAKPVILEEYGLPPSPARDSAYAAWLDMVEEKDGAGDLVWMLGFPEQGDQYLLSDSADAPSIAEHSRRYAKRG